MDQSTSEVQGEIDLVKCATIKVAQDYARAQQHARNLKNALLDDDVTWRSTGEQVLEYLEVRTNHSESVAQAPSVQPRHSQRTGSTTEQKLVEEFLGQSVKDGDSAVKTLIGRGASVVPEAVDWLRTGEGHLTRTHRVQLFHRYKTLFATFPQQAAPAPRGVDAR